MKKIGSFTGNERSTTLVNDKGTWLLTYHDTVVCRYNSEDGILELCAGGWHTATTVKRINQFCETFNLPLYASRTYKRATYIYDEQIKIHLKSRTVELPYEDSLVIGG